MRRPTALIVLLMLIGLVGCGLLPDENAVEPPTVTPTLAATPTNTPVPVITPDVAISSPVTKTRTTLTVWIPPELWMASETSQATFMQQFDAYRANHPGLDLRVEPKAVTGQGSILNYLRAGRAIAPDIMPDLIALPSYQLSTAYSDELIFPLDGYVGPLIFEDVVPAGLNLVKQGDQIIGYPFVLSQPPHLAYDSAFYTDTVPMFWEEFAQLPDQAFVFPAAGSGGATLLLELYLDAGGTLTNEAGQFELQLGPLVEALQYLSDGRVSGFILPQSSEIQTLADAWSTYQGGSATFVQTSADAFFRQRSDELPTEVAAIPGVDGPLPPLVSGWAWAISSPDSVKRPLAAELLTYLVDTPNLGEWSAQSMLLPAREGALVFWPEDDPYVSFAGDQLLVADSHPFSPNHEVMLALSDAVFDVVSLTKSPQVAAEEAILTLQE